MNEVISTAVTEGNVYDIEEIISRALGEGKNPKDLLDAMMAGLKACGDRFETGEYFLPELIGAAEAFQAGMGVLAVEMETTALYMNAAQAGVNALSILSVSDSLVDHSAMSAHEREVGFAPMIELALSLA